MERLDSFLEEKNAVKDIMRLNDIFTIDPRLDRGLINVEFEPDH